MHFEKQWHYWSYMYADGSYHSFWYWIHPDPSSFPYHSANNGRINKPQHYALQPLMFSTLLCRGLFFFFFFPTQYCNENDFWHETGFECNVLLQLVNLWTALQVHSCQCQALYYTESAFMARTPNSSTITELLRKDKQLLLHWKTVTSLDIKYPAQLECLLACWDFLF